MALGYTRFVVRKLRNRYVMRIQTGLSEGSAFYSAAAGKLVKR